MAMMNEIHDCNDADDGSAAHMCWALASERAGMQCNNATQKYNFWCILMPATLPQMQKFLHHNGGR